MKYTKTQFILRRVSLVLVLGLAVGLGGSALLPGQSQAATPGITTSNLWITGVDGSNNPLGANGTDPHYEIASVTNATNPPCEPGNIAAGGTPTSPVWPAPLVAVKQYNGNTEAGNVFFAEYQNGYDETQSANFHPWRYIAPNARWIGLNQYGQDYSTPGCVNPSNWPIRKNIDRNDYTNWGPTWNEFRFRAKQSFTVNVDPLLVDVNSLRFRIVGKADNHMSVQINACRLQAIDHKVDGNDIPTTAPTVWADSLYYDSQTITNFSVPAGCINTTGPNSLSFYVRSGWSNTGLLITDMSIEGTPLPPGPPPAPPPPPRPYFQSEGGDVVAGTSMSTPDATGAMTPCTLAPHVDDPGKEAGIVSWNYDGNPSYAGAGGEYAAFALGQVQSYVTGQGTGPANDTNDLTFANANYGTSVDFSKGYYGGMFGSAPCIDLWADKPAATTPLPAGPVGGWPSGVYSVNGNVTLDSATLGSGKQITLYVNGNVSIIGDITNAGQTFAKRKDIPLFKLIVHGVIYIDNDVGRLDGLYAAIPDTGATTKQNQFAAPIAGTISTCSTGFNSYDPTKILTTYASMPGDCDEQLQIRGSVVAHQLWLLRTGGSLGGSPAEVITYTPEIWLAPSGTGTGVGSDEYQSIIGLPPTL